MQYSPVSPFTTARSPSMFPSATTSLNFSWPVSETRHWRSAAAAVLPGWWPSTRASWPPRRKRSSRWSA
eukprot:8154-Pyramimonas_sp.AAC.1